jgi:hypothetical protein
LCSPARVPIGTGVLIAQVGSELSSDVPFRGEKLYCQPAS